MSHHKHEWLVFRAMNQHSIFVWNFHCRWNMVLLVWSQKWMTKFAMETTNIPTTQENLHVKITNEASAHHLLLYHGYYSLWINSTRPDIQPSLLCGNNWSCIQRKAWTFVWLDSLPWQCFSAQSALCQVVSGPHIDYWNGPPPLHIPLIWLWMISGWFCK